MQIIESNMLFEFEDSKVFYIEKSELQKHIGDGIKTVEFIVRLKPGELDFVEAKSSSPRPTKENTVKFNDFIEDISEKFIHSFNLYLSVALGKNKSEEIPEELKVQEYLGIKFKFILIIKGHMLEWLPPLSEALNTRLIYHNKIWGSQVILMNEELAIEHKLVKSCE